MRTRSGSEYTKRLTLFKEQGHSLCVCTWSNVPQYNWSILEDVADCCELRRFTCVFIQKMHKCFQQWSVDSSELLTLSCKGIFDNFYVVKSHYLNFFCKCQCCAGWH